VFSWGCSLFALWRARLIGEINRNDHGRTDYAGTVYPVPQPLNAAQKIQFLALDLGAAHFDALGLPLFWRQGRAAPAFLGW
jgi:hypothetical protein